MRGEREVDYSRLSLRSNKNSQLYTDNWYLRPSRSPSHSGSDQHRHSPVEIMAGPSRTSVSQARPPYERQISRVRSLSVFSSHSHIHPDTQPDTGDTISLDFDVLDEEPEVSRTGVCLTVI